MSLTATVSTPVQPWKLVLSQSLSLFALRSWSRLGPLISLKLCCTHYLIIMGSHRQKLTCCMLHPVTLNTQYTLARIFFSIRSSQVYQSNWECVVPPPMDPRLPLSGFGDKQGDADGARRAATRGGGVQEGGGWVQAGQYKFSSQMGTLSRHFTVTIQSFRLITGIVIDSLYYSRSILLFF